MVKPRFNGVTEDATCMILDYHCLGPTRIQFNPPKVNSLTLLIEVTVHGYMLSTWSHRRNRDNLIPQYGNKLRCIHTGGIITCPRH